MDPRALARQQALGRVAAGVAILAAPRLTAASWLGVPARQGGPRAAITGLGARDIGLGLGGAWALGAGEPARAWLLAGVLADIVDLAAALRYRDDLPTAGFLTVSLVAGGSAVLGAWLATQVD